MVQVCAFYYFTPLIEAEFLRLKSELEFEASQLAIRGLVLLGAEGINFTISGNASSMEQFTSWLSGRMNIESPEFKFSFTPRHPFHIFKVKIKDEIVTMGQPGVVPAGKNGHISPAEWHAKVRQGDAVVLDTRNDYEVEIGKFKNAIDFNIKEFQDFPKELERAQIPKEKEVLIYCTGGIRCEKAMLEMQRQGYSKVHQLHGGILNYLKEFPSGEFDGECFVFDYRVAVDQQLNPTQKYRLCAHCGQPSASEIECTLCRRPGVVCSHCAAKGIQTCSKNCANHARLGSKSTRPHLQEHRKRHRNRI